MSHEEATPSAQSGTGETYAILEALRARKALEQFEQFRGTKTAQQGEMTSAPSAPEEGEYTAASLGQKKIHEIKDILRQLGKRVTGNKEDLIARILGLEEPGTTKSPKKKKRSADEMGEGGDSDEDDEDGDGPAAKKFKVDKSDPIWGMCFLCQSKEDLVKYKDIRQCSKCKAYWKGKRLLRQDAEALFLLQQSDLENLPHRDTQGQGGQTIPLYAFATCAGAAVKRYGSLYHMVKSDPAQREALAQHLTSERAFAEDQAPEAEYDGTNAQRAGDDASPNQTTSGYSDAAEN